MQRSREAEIFAAAERFAVEHAAVPEQAAIFATAFHDLRRSLDRPTISPYFFGCIHLPLLVHAAITGDDAPAVPLATAAMLLSMGITVLDAIMDNELSENWRPYHAGEITLAAVTLIASHAPLALCEIEAPPEILLGMQRTLARGGLAMSGGQQRDLTLARGDRLTLAEARAIAAAKNGEWLALIAAMSAQLAGAATESVERYAALGLALGTARQLFSDCCDIFTEQHSKDLASGTRGLPAALYLRKLEPAEASRFCQMLDEARTSPERAAAVRARLVAAGVVRECATIVELYCGQAHTALQRCRPAEPAATGLRLLIDDCSFFTPQPAQAL